MRTCMDLNICKVVSQIIGFTCISLVFFHLYTLFSTSSDIQRVGEGHPSACLTNYSKGILLVDYLYFDAAIIGKQL